MNRLTKSLIGTGMAAELVFVAGCSSEPTAELRVDCTQKQDPSKLGRILEFRQLSTSASNGNSYEVSDGTVTETLYFHNGVITGENIKETMTGASGAVIQEFPTAELIDGRPAKSGEYILGGYAMTLVCKGVSPTEINGPANIVAIN